MKRDVSFQAECPFKSGVYNSVISTYCTRLPNIHTSTHAHTHWSSPLATAVHLILRSEGVRLGLKQPIRCVFVYSIRPRGRVCVSARVFRYESTGAENVHMNRTGNHSFNKSLHSNNLRDNDKARRKYNSILQLSFSCKKIKNLDTS